MCVCLCVNVQVHAAHMLEPTLLLICVMQAPTQMYIAPQRQTNSILKTEIWLADILFVM